MGCSKSKHFRRAQHLALSVEGLGHTAEFEIFICHNTHCQIQLMSFTNNIKINGI